MRQTIATFIPLLHVRAVASLWTIAFQKKKGATKAFAMTGAVLHGLSLAVMLIAQWWVISIIIGSYFPILLRSLSIDAVPSSLLHQNLYRTLVTCWVISLLATTLLTTVYAICIKWEDEAKNRQIKTSWKEYLGLSISSVLLSAPTQILIMGMIALLFKIQVEPIQVVGPGMSPTFSDGDYAIVLKNKATTRITRGEIVLFRMPNGRKRIGRVIGVPGEKVILRSGFVWIGPDNTQSQATFLAEDYVKNPGQTYPCPVDVRNVQEYEYQTQDGYFIMGDNRTESDDARCETNANGSIVKRESIDGSVIRKIGAKEHAYDVRFLSLPSYRYMNTQEIEERIISADDFTTITYPRPSDDVRALDQFTLRGYVTGAVSEMRILTNGSCGSSTTTQILKSTEGKKEWQFLIDRRKGNLCQGKNLITVESSTGEKSEQLVSLLQYTIESDVGLNGPESKDILLAIEKHILPASESLDGQDIAPIRISGEFCKNHSGEKSPIFGSPITKINADLWARVIIEKNIPTLVFYGEENGISPQILKPIPGYECPSFSAFDVVGVGKNAVFVTYFPGGEMPPVPYIWVDNTWMTGETFLAKFTTMVKQVDSRLTLRMNTDRFSLTESPLCCDISSTLYPAKWSEFIFDLPSMKNLGIVLHEKNSR